MGWPGARSAATPVVCRVDLYHADESTNQLRYVCEESWSNNTVQGAVPPPKSDNGQR